jgi:hypothetical protein
MVTVTLPIEGAPAVEAGERVVQLAPRSGADASDASAATGIINEEQRQRRA